VTDALSRHVHLPRGPERELVHHRDREYTLRGSESPTLATVGAFPVVSSRDHRGDIGVALLTLILRQGGVTRKEWESV
jgi:hypothetical protein